jgi:hypothetical protein
MRLEHPSASPSSEQLSSLNAEPYLHYKYSASSSSSQSPCMPQLFSWADSPVEASLKKGFATSLDPSSTSADGSWDEYIAWDSLPSPMFSQPNWSFQAIHGSPSPPLCSEFSDIRKPLERPDSFAPKREFEMTPDSTLPLRSAATTFDPSQPSSTPDSGFTSRSTSCSTHSSFRNPADSCTTSRTKRGSSSVRPPSRKKAKKTKPATHNDVEKRYRANLNAKIAELGASVPSLRSKKASENVSNDDMDVETRSSSPIRGLNKATILSRAATYIRLLEGEMESLAAENVLLKKRLALCGRIAVEEESK